MYTYHIIFYINDHWIIHVFKTYNLQYNEVSAPLIWFDLPGRLSGLWVMLNVISKSWSHERNISSCGGGSLQFLYLGPDRRCVIAVRYIKDTFNRILGRFTAAELFRPTPASLAHDLNSPVWISDLFQLSPMNPPYSDMSYCKKNIVYSGTIGTYRILPLTAVYAFCSKGLFQGVKWCQSCKFQTSKNLREQSWVTNSWPIFSCSDDCLRKQSYWKLQWTVRSPMAVSELHCWHQAAFWWRVESRSSILRMAKLLEPVACLASSHKRMQRWPRQQWATSSHKPSSESLRCAEPQMTRQFSEWWVCIANGNSSMKSLAGLQWFMMTFAVRLHSEVRGLCT